MANKLESLVTQLNEKVSEFNIALKEKNFDLIQKLEVEIKEIEVAYAEEKAYSVYKELLVKDDALETVKKAVIQYSYDVLRHKDNKENGVIIERIVEQKARQIDLLKMCKFLDLPTAWQYKVERLNQLMTLRIAKELKVPVKADTFFMQEQSRKIEMGETPTSNTKLCKALQIAIDGIIYEDDGKGNNIHKANNHDVAYLLAIFTRKGKEKLGVATAKHDFLRRIIMDILYRITTDSKYGIEFKMVKEKSKAIEPEAKNDEAKSDKDIVA